MSRNHLGKTAGENQPVRTYADCGKNNEIIVSHPLLKMIEASGCEAERSM